jgi:hypothetical protein
MKDCFVTRFKARFDLVSVPVLTALENGTVLTPIMFVTKDFPFIFFKGDTETREMHVGSS